MSATSGGNKASFIALDGDAGTFEVQYNPKEFKVNKSVSWKPHDDQGQDASGLEFQKGEPMSLSMELFFDTTNEGNADVRAKWVNGFLKLTNPEVRPSEGGADKKRPPRVKFVWGTFELECVIEKVDVTYMMFSSDGTPVRARVSVSMKEWEPKAADKAAGGKAYSLDTVRLVTTSSNTSASAVAAQQGTDWRPIADDNDLSDPSDIPAGTTLVVRN